MADEREERSTKEVVGAVLDDFERLSRELFESLSAASLYRSTKQVTNAEDTTSSKVVDQLIEKNKELQDVVKIAEDQQRRQQDIQTAKENLAKKDQEILSLEAQLKEAEQILAQALFQAKKKLKASEQASDGVVSSEELIKYAHRISSSNAVEAPISWMPGDPRRPYPQDIEMRSGLLGRLGETVAQTGGLESHPSTATSNLQETGHVPAPNGVDVLPNGQSTLSWQPQLQGASAAVESSSGVAGLDVTMEVVNGERETGLDEVEFMSSSSSSSSSDSQ